MKVYHVTSPKKLAKYQMEGKINGPVRAWCDVFEAVRFSCSTGREIILRLKFPDDAKRLGGHGGNAVIINEDFILPDSLVCCASHSALQQVPAPGHNPNMGVLFVSTDGFKVCRAGQGTECDLYHHDEFICTIPDEAAAFKIKRYIREAEDSKEHDAAIAAAAIKQERERIIRKAVSELMKTGFHPPMDRIVAIIDNGGK